MSRREILGQWMVVPANYRVGKVAGKKLLAHSCLSPMALSSSAMVMQARACQSNQPQWVLFGLQGDLTACRSVADSGHANSKEAVHH